MAEDQRFAARRPDVLVYETPPLEGEATLSGPIGVELHVKISTTDADFVVKVIDVFPDSAVDPEPNPRGVRLAGAQMLIRGDIMRGKFRTGYGTPQPFVPGEAAVVSFQLPDINHTLRPGHRLMVQVQSTWFPLADRNPQTFVDIGKATEADFKPSHIHILRSKTHASSIRVNVSRGRL